MTIPALVARGRRQPPPDVVADRYRLQVGRVDARGEPAQVIDVQAVGDRADEQLVDEPMGGHNLLAVPYPSVASFVPAPGPLPAPIVSG
jgi:hypothetical protein